MHPVPFILILLYTVLILWLATGTLRNQGNPPPIPSSRAHLARARHWIQQYAMEGTMIEIGSGWGGRWRSLAGPTLHYVGVELLGPLNVLSRLLAYGNPLVKFYWGDIRHRTIDSYQLIVGYLGRDLNQWVVQQARNHDQYFISVIFELPQPTVGVTLLESHAHWTGNIYLYRLHAQVPLTAPSAQV